MTSTTHDPFGVHADALLLRSYRATVLARNLANSDTPGFKARDLDFGATLARLVGGDGAVDLAVTRPGHQSGRTDTPRGVSLAYRTASQPSLDGNTVDADVEKAAYMQNALRFQASLRFLQNRIEGVRKALRSE